MAASSFGSLHNYDRSGIVLFEYDKTLGAATEEHIIHSSKVGEHQSFYFNYTSDVTIRVTIYFDNGGTVPESKIFDISPNYDPLAPPDAPIPCGLISGDISAQNLTLSVQNLDAPTTSNTHLHVSGYFTTL